MKRIVFYIVLPLIVAAASIWNLVKFRLDNLLDPSIPELTTLSWYGAFLFVAVAVILAIRLRLARPWIRRVALVLALVVIVAAGFAPRLVDAYISQQQQAVQQAEGADVEMEFQSAYLDRSDDIDARTDAHKPYTGEEALAFLEFAADSDLTWRSLPDHTPETFALVEQAITAGVLDPNTIVAPPVADSSPKTVTLAFYDKRIRPAAPLTIARHDWEVLQILVATGADVSSPDAAPLRADLARTVVPGTGRYLQLK